MPRRKSNKKSRRRKSRRRKSRRRKSQRRKSNRKYRKMKKSKRRRKSRHFRMEKGVLPCAAGLATFFLSHGACGCPIGISACGGCGVLGGAAGLLHCAKSTDNDLQQPLRDPPAPDNETPPLCEMQKKRPKNALQNYRGLCAPRPGYTPRKGKRKKTAAYGTL